MVAAAWRLGYTVWGSWMVRDSLSLARRWGLFHFNLSVFQFSAFGCRCSFHPASMARILEEWLLAAYGLDAFLTIF